MTSLRSGVPAPTLERIAARCRALDSALVLGLDPPLAIDGEDLSALRERLLAMVSATAPHVVAVKPNAAFFEARGPAGWALLAEVCQAARALELPVILDSKRGDIASTAEAYAAAARALPADAVTLHGYMGADSVAPSLAGGAMAAFVLARTSNPSAATLQALSVRAIDGADRPLYLEVARQWAPYADRVGLVVGATDPAALAAVRAIAPDSWLLAPGLGAQGGDLQAAVSLGLRADGLGLLLPLSRALWPDLGLGAAAAGVAAAALAAAFVAAFRGARDAGRAQRSLAMRPLGAQPLSSPAGAPTSTQASASASAPASASASASAPAPALASSSLGLDAAPSPDQHQRLALALFDCQAVRFGRFRLKSGIDSPIYLDLRMLCGHPDVLRQAVAAMAPLLSDLAFERIAALPLAGLPIGTALALEGGWPMVFPRPQRKDHGTGALVEGPHRRGERVVLIDDLATRGTSALELLPSLRGAGLQVLALCVLVDRAAGAAAGLAAEGIALRAVFTLPELLDLWRDAGRIDAAARAEVLAFLRDAGTP